MPEDPKKLDYAPAEPMSRNRFAAIIGAAAVTGILIGGVTYALAQPTTSPMLGGEMVAPRPILTTQPSCPPLPGAPAPTTQEWTPVPTTKPVTE